MLSAFLKSIVQTGPYTYGVQQADRGLGVGNRAFGRPYAPPASGQYGPRYNVRGSMNPTAGAGLIVAQSLPKVDLRGRGVYFAGDFSLTALSAPGNG